MEPREYRPNNTSPEVAACSQLFAVLAEKISRQNHNTIYSLKPSGFFTQKVHTHSAILETLEGDRFSLVRRLSVNKNGEQTSLHMVVKSIEFTEEKKYEGKRVVEVAYNFRQLAAPTYDIVVEDPHKSGKQKRIGDDLSLTEIEGFAHDVFFGRFIDLEEARAHFEDRAN